MRTVSYRIGDLNKAVIHIGRVAENEYTRVQIDAGEIFAEYPAASASLTVQPPEGSAYPATVTRDGNLVIWDVKDSDLTADGNGEIQLTFTNSAVVVKSAIGRISVCRSIVASGEAPDPVQDWISDATDVLEALEDAIPEGGTQGQVLAKASDEDYDLEWVEQSGGVADYDELENRPQIGGTTLTGNKSLSDLGIASSSDVSGKADKADTVLTTTLSRGRLANSTVGVASFAFGNDVEAAGYYSQAEGNGTSTETNNSHVFGKYNVPNDKFPVWSSNTHYYVGDKVRRKITFQSSVTYIPFECIEENTDSSWTSSHWEELNDQNIDGEYVEVVGNGANYGNKSNARALDWDGNEYLKGDLYVGCDADSTNGSKVAKVSELTSIIDDTAGDGDTSKVWSADKSYDEKTALLSKINGKYTLPNTGIPSTDLASGVQTSLGKADTAYQKPSTGIPASDLASGVIPSVPVQDVQVNGTSVLSNGVANVPMANGTNPGVVVVREGNDGLLIDSSNRLSINPATTSQIKSGSNNYRVITPFNQSYSTFYGLATASGDTTQSASSNAVGVYTDSAKIAIQKMLGIYEAPWELIREDTVTLATKGNIEVSVDSNGNSFELTDIYCTFGLPQQETEAKVEDYGRVKFYIGSTNTATGYLGAWTQAANASAKSGTVLLEQKKNTIQLSFTKGTGEGSEPSAQMANARTTGTSATVTGRLMFYNEQQVYTKVVFEGITGIAKYKVYGKRKWTV